MHCPTVLLFILDYCSILIFPRPPTHTHSCFSSSHCLHLTLKYFNPNATKSWIIHDALERTTIKYYTSLNHSGTAPTASSHLTISPSLHLSTSNCPTDINHGDKSHVIIFFSVKRCWICNFAPVSTTTAAVCVLCFGDLY